MSERVYLLTICLPLATVLLVFGMRYMAKVQEAKARLAQGDATRALAEKSLSAQAEIGSALSSIDAKLSELKARVASIETILKAVE
jgi:hypothetical protein